jgi:hypothetical protein
MLLWALWFVASCFFHEDPLSALKFRAGLVYEAVGVYFLVRIFCRTPQDVPQALRIAALVLVALSLPMVYEKVTGTDPFSVFGGVSEYSQVRVGNVRAQGPFGHPILAGTVGAVCLPMMVGLWPMRPKMALAGCCGCLAIVFAAASSGPILSGAAGLLGLALWRFRARIRWIQLLAVALYAALALAMKAPAYYLIAKIDLAGGSTSWYRARLIESAFEHFDEWWFAGTDYTRHWMPVLVPWSPNHTDITSHYLQMGVWGGMPLVVLFVIILLKGFKGVVRASTGMAPDSPLRFALWSVGSSLFSLVATCLSVSFFDQTIAFLYLTLGVIAAAWSFALRHRTKRVVTAPRAVAASASYPRYGI